jgi:DNA-directed RNA polymerase subunit RPC12/RpoP
MTVTATTAEWVCTRCGSTNRMLVPADTQKAEDRCVHCRTLHTVRPGKRPVRWDAELRN